MENIIASGNEVNPVCLKIFNYLDNKSAIRLSQVNITAWKKFRNDSRFSEIPELKYIIQNSCKFCWEISSGVLNSGNKNEISTIIKLYIRWENKGTNPISGKVWNDVIRRAWVNLTCKCFRQYKYPKRPHIGHNLFLATYFDIFLAIESKISPKVSIFLTLLAPIWEWSKLTFFKPKIIKSSYFEFQKSYIPYPRQ